jgi:selenide,water dikinase
VLQKPTGGANLSVPGDDAAVLKQPGGGFQVISADHLRALIHDPALMARIAAVHALGDIWAMGAQPQAALSSIVLPHMSQQLQTRTLQEITAAAREIFDRAGAAIVGGHTTMGAEMTIGFTVTGTRETQPISLSGAQAGDCLVLTRPIGSGIIMAAHMEGAAAGADVTQALDEMAEPQDRQAFHLRRANAMTDVTGFGLAGHIAAICRASHLSAEIFTDAVPTYSGARDLSDRGVQSSLFQPNVDNAPTRGRRDPLVYDPQTAGGLLAALSPTEAQVAINNMAAEGKKTWIIGRLTEGEGPTTLV